MKYIRYTIIFTFILIILASGYLAFKFLGGSGRVREKSNQVNVPNSQNQPNVSQSPSWLSGLTDVERSIFNVPSNESSSEEKNKFSSLVRKISHSADHISIARQCRPSPIVYSVGQASSYKFKNEDTVAHTVRFGLNETYEINPGATVEIKVTPEMSAQILSFGCDNYSIVGFLVFRPL